MKFSIREMLAVTFLIALGLLAWRTWEGMRRDQARLLQLKNEIKDLEARVRLDRPVLHQALLHMHDEFAPLHAMRERSIEQFDLIRKKYNSIEPRGAKVFSMRGIPSLPTDTGSAPVIFRMLVPEDRPVWLKFGVRMLQQGMDPLRPPVDELKLLTDSPFSASGPFEVRLPPGDQTLKISIGSAAEGSLPVEITLADEVLLRSTFVSAGIFGTSSSHVAALSQLDIGPRQDLPSLLTARVNLPAPASGKAPASKYAFSIWLSDRTSEFASFPGE